MVGRDFGKFVCPLVLRWFLAPALICIPSLQPLSAASDTKTSSSVVAGPVEAQPSEIAFSGVPVGETYTQPVRVTNAGETALQIKEVTPSSAELRITGIFLPVVIAPGMSETFLVAYRASKAGPAPSEIRILLSGSEEPIVLPVHASAIAVQTELTASVATVEFQDVAVGNAVTKEVRVKNNGNREARISGIAASGEGFRVTRGGMTLAPQQETLLHVQFAPKSEGYYSGELTITGQQEGSLLTIPLTATGARSSAAMVRLNWEESPVTVAGYVVYRSTEPSGPFVRLSDEVGATEYVDSGLAAGHTYYYVVTALDADRAETEYSAPITATIPVG